jgi:hypothetical protein
MPRLSLYKPERGQDYTFIDRQISEMFQAGGTDVYLHKYLGPKNPETGTAAEPVYATQSVTNIQDLLFLENRDRKYDQEIYRIRGLYNVQNIDFNLSQFGLFIDNDTLFMTVHINDFIKYIGRKPISGDVLELPHLRDDFALGDFDVTLPRYYVIEDVGRASEGFSATWYPHLYRLKLRKITDNQQFADILTKPVDTSVNYIGDYATGTTYYPGDVLRYNGALYQVKQTVGPAGTTSVPADTTSWEPYTENTLRDLLSTHAKELQINDQLLAQAAADAPKSGYETRQFYTLDVNEKGETVLNTADSSTLDASNASYRAGENNGRPPRTGYTGYLVGDGFPVNGYDFGHGIQFPDAAGKDDFFLRTDFMPSRLFRFDGSRWIKVEDNVRMDLSNSDTRQTLKTGFINNDKWTYVDTIVTDFVSLTQGVSVIDTDISYQQAPYVVFKLEVLEFGYSTTEYPSMVTNNNGKIRITLPEIDNEQQVIPNTGVWRVSLSNHRKAQKQSLSKALKPKADL